MLNILLSRGILHHPHIYHEVKQYLKKTDRVVILAFSFFKDQFSNEDQYHEFYEKNGEYYQKMIDTFAPYGITENHISWINYYKDTKETAIKKIKEADIIYFPGGAPDLMMERIHAFGLIEAIESFNKTYIGSSAGAMIQLENYHISKDNEYPSFSYEKGLHLLKDISIEVHYRRRKKQKSALRKVFRAYQHPIFAIPDDGALIIEQGKVTPIGSAFQVYDQKGIIRR